MKKYKSKRKAVKTVKHKGYKIKNIRGRERKKYPAEFPFWARLKIDKCRPTLVIDEAPAKNKKTGRLEAGFVHREAIHTYKKDYEEIKINPNTKDSKPMYLKRPSKLPQRLFKPVNQTMEMPDHLKERYKK